MAQAPLLGTRVVNIGGHWAGRVAAMLLADQGADVIEILPVTQVEPHPADLTLDRGKRLLRCNLKQPEVLAEVKAEVLADCDIIIDNVRPDAAAKLGIDHASLTAMPARRRPLIYLALPGFAEGDPRRGLPAWEGSIAAAAGVYTDVLPTHQLLGGDPIYTAIPMASAYGGVLGALAATLALFRRAASGVGQRVEVPLADAVMSAMAWLIVRVEGQPERYNYPAVSDELYHGAFPVLRQFETQLSAIERSALMSHVRAHPGLCFYPAADARTLFVCCPDHALGFRALLLALGCLEHLTALGFVLGSPFTEATDGRDLLHGFAMRPDQREIVRTAIAAAIATRPAAEWAATLQAAGVPACVVQTCSEWMADPAHIASQVHARVESAAGSVVTPGRFFHVSGAHVASPPLPTAATHRPVVSSGSGEAGSGEAGSGEAGSGEARSGGLGSGGLGSGGLDWDGWRGAPVECPPLPLEAPRCGMLDGVRILDLSNIIAAPSAGRLLAEHGADVTHVYSPTSAASPLVTLHFGIEVHRGKRSTIIDLKSAAGARAFAALVKRADVVLHNFLDGAAERLGITQAQLREINPQVVSCQVTSNGGGVRTGTLRRCAQPVLRRSGPWGSNRHLEAVCAAGAQTIGPVGFEPAP